MKNVGFHGGHTVYEHGPAADMIVFFQCIALYGKNVQTDYDFSLLTDRLYRRYLRESELIPAMDLMSTVESLFCKIPSNPANWIMMGVDFELTKLDLNQPTLHLVFVDYFHHFYEAKESAESFLDIFKIYQPVKIVITELPWFIEDKNRPLEQYDALGPDDPPFWLR
ncbi:hypothetical protein [Yersinia sp. Marseille-Q3913]|uniref:hypothetical protein n=1 Tax=Yersinia sp. Marseille-Q3913 TaxID=2830769 RepID=UPI001BB06F72|nr:hypothetical protein [Yersinia sp. Marseille-Q3913]MBS0057358.1 hypothetical protein [Yersinia sp. Marseille-Q3913]